MRNGNLLKTCVSEIRIRRFRLLYTRSFMYKLHLYKVLSNPKGKKIRTGGQLRNCSENASVLVSDPSLKKQSYIKTLWVLVVRDFCFCPFGQPAVLKSYQLSIMRYCWGRVFSCFYGQKMFFQKNSHCGVRTKPYFCK